MPYKVAAFYQFAALPDFRALREPLYAICAASGVKGSVLLAAEGVNGTLAGPEEGIAALLDELRHGALFGGRLDNLELKFSHAAVMPFGRLKVRLKKEIVTLRTAWNWGMRMKIVSGRYPYDGLRYPKGDEKPPFQTRREIERGLLTVRIADAGKSWFVWKKLRMEATPERVRELEEFVSELKLLLEPRV